MGELKNLYCIIGKSGIGKTTTVDKLETEYRYKVLKSFTTRAPRNEGDADHTYISLDEYMDLEDKVATCCFNGNYYCATAEQVENSDLYVIDCDGVKELKTKYAGAKRIIFIQLVAPMDVCLERMLKRGDSEDAAWERLRHDYTAFAEAGKLIDYTVPADDDNVEAWKAIKKIIDYEEVK